jgi:hypothetical protein
MVPSYSERLYKAPYLSFHFERECIRDKPAPRILNDCFLRIG